MRRVFIALVLLVLTVVAYVRIAGGGTLGVRWHVGEPTARPRAAERVASEAAAQSGAARALGAADAKQILFGDLHVHTTFSPDAFMMALPSSGGDGAHPVNDACDFARYCSALDFWSINDHDVGLTPAQWQETIGAIRQCDAVGGGGESPDTTAFLGWEWTQIGSTPDNHYGHKNVVLRGLADDQIPTRPITAATDQILGDEGSGGMAGPWTLGLLALFRPGRESFDFIRFWNDIAVKPCAEGVPVRDLPDDCRESVKDPAGLFAKLDEWGFDSIVIPHGTTWGIYTPAGSAWDKQIVGEQYDPQRETLIEVFSGHGNSEEFRAWREVEIAADGTKTCPAPSGGFTPSCWRAGELIAERCAAEGGGADDCATRAETARASYVAADLAGHLTVPGSNVEDWLDSGQCPDCFQPSFNYRPRSSVQYIMALRDFENPQQPRRFDFGFMASSDNHSARPGTGYKEVARDAFTEARLPLAASQFFPPREPEEAVAHSVPFDPKNGTYQFFDLRESERASSFFLNGGLVAAHANGRSRDAIWDALQRREVYGTSGPRILLWFDLVSATGGGAGEVATPLATMGSSLAYAEPPHFSVRAVGSFEQKPGCPDDSTQALGPEKLARLCRGECYFPSEKRRRIARIEVVRIRPQNAPGEPIEPLIEDPWQTLACEPSEAGCAVTFSDPEFVSSGRDTLYYVRAIEEQSLAVNADLLRCERDGSGKCVRVKPCIGAAPDDECLAETEERAWSSPIFLEHAGAMPAEPAPGPATGNALAHAAGAEH
ncbi:MAG TPA: DUF3604 domain-containing protein [Myxococcota bacterium]|nr:DUF3604 domain-containing protein [Myxococcota bacterium]